MADPVTTSAVPLAPAPTASVAPSLAVAAPAAAPVSALAAKVEALHVEHFSGSRLGFDTEMCNLVRKFTDEVKTLLAAAERVVKSAV